MESFALDGLEEIISISGQILRAVSSRAPVTAATSISGKPSESIKLFPADIKLFKQSLMHLNLSNSLAEKLEELCNLQVANLCHRFELFLKKTGQLFVMEGEKDEKSQFDRLISISQRLLHSRTLDLHQAIISTVKSKKRDFEESGVKNDIESSGESSVAQKGHSPRAIAILEKVFAQTPNINRSEKLQLARATKLEPRQVTIWFQNRRNRKPTNQAHSGIRLQNNLSTLSQQGKRKRKIDDVNGDVPQTPTQRRRLSDSDAASLAFPSHRRHETPLSTSSCERSSSVDLFENSQSAHSNGGTSCGTSYDDSFSSYQNFSPPISTFGMNSFDDQVVRFTNAKVSGRSGDNKKEMMFNENGEVLLDWDDLELNLEDFNDTMFQAVTSNTTVQTGKQYIGSSTDVVLPKSKEETNLLITIFARKLVEEQFNAQQGLQQVQQSEGWQSPVFDKIFLAKEEEQDMISLAELQSSQSSNPGGPSTSNSTQTSPRSGTPKSLFNFDFDSLGLDDSMQYNNESIEQKVDSIDLFVADELIKFDLLTTDALGLICSTETTSPSTATNDGTPGLTLLQ